MTIAQTTTGSESDNFVYVGQELDLFSHAENWKRYWASKVLPFLKGDILEVGAGFGGTTSFICSKEHRSWVCLEPDDKLAARLREQVKSGKLPSQCEVITGTTASIQGRSFDTIIYIDVLEHIEHDSAEILQATRLLKPGGNLIVLSPAFQTLYSEFDKAIGHYRRYTKKTLRACNNPQLTEITAMYLDSLGCALSFGNRLFTQQSQPKLKQLLFWDRCIIPISRWIDPILSNFFGRSVIVVWQKR